MSEEISHISSIGKKKKNIKNVFIVIGGVVLIALLALGGYFSYQYWVLQKTFGKQKAAVDEVQRLTSDVGKTMLLPSNETPTVATVVDVNKLKDQVFFQNAKNGDKLLVYAVAREAIIYRPQSHLIVNVGPLNIAGQQPSQASAAKIGLRNGTSITGLATKTESDIQKLFPGANVAAKDQSSRTDYDKTVVIPLSDAAKNAAADLAKGLNATVGSLPSAESKPTGIDILIIVGKDRS